MRSWLLLFVLAGCTSGGEEGPPEDTDTDSGEDTDTDTDEDTDPPVSLCQPVDGLPEQPGVRPFSTFAETEPIAATPLAYPLAQMAAGDFDGDGDDDITVVSSTGHWFVDENLGDSKFWRNDGTGHFEDATSEVFGATPPVGDQSRDPTVADFNGDGVDDVFFGQHGWDADPFPGAIDLLLLSQDDDTMLDGSVSNLDWNEPTFTHSVATGDFDCDGDLDIFQGVLDDQGSRIFFNDGNGSFTSNTDVLPATLLSQPLSGHVLSSDACDVDRDGDPDLIIGGDVGLRSRSILLLNDGFGRFDYSEEEALPEAAWGLDTTTVEVTCTDMDLDGWPDIVASETKDWYSEPSLRFWHNDGDGTFTDRTDTSFPPLDFSEGQNWFMLVHTDDLNGDGWPDIVANDVCFVWMLQNNGDGTFTDRTFRLPNGPCDGSIEHLHPLIADDNSLPDMVLLRSSYAEGGAQDKPSLLYRNLGTQPRWLIGDGATPSWSADDAVPMIQVETGVWWSTTTLTADRGFRIYDSRDDGASDHTYADWEAEGYTIDAALMNGAPADPDGSMIFSGATGRYRVVLDTNARTLELVPR